MCSLYPTTLWHFIFVQVSSVQLLLAACAACVACVVCAEPPGGGCTQCPTSEPFTLVSITEGPTYRRVVTNTCPPYENPGWTNHATACENDKTLRIPLNPKFSKVPIPVGEEHSEYGGFTYLKSDPTPIFGVIGVLVNGVEVFGVGSPCGYTAVCSEKGAPTDYVDAVDAESHTVDTCGGHAAPTGSYHVHSGTGINSTEQREACQLPVDVEGEHSQLLGWMFDGFGLYGRYSQGGQVPTELDECSGHTHEIDGVMTYHYHIPDQFPWTIGCFKGCPKVSNNKMELSTINSSAEYGCPEGLDEDPDPLIESAPGSDMVISII